jgi:hypothetical protein
MRRGDRVRVKILTGLFESFRFVGCRGYPQKIFDEFCREEEYPMASRPDQQPMRLRGEIEEARVSEPGRLSRGLGALEPTQSW